MNSAWSSGLLAQQHRFAQGGRNLIVAGCVFLAAATAAAQPPVPGFTARLLDLDRRLEDAVQWTDAVLNGHGITYHDVQLDIVDTVDVVNFGRTTEVFNPDTEEFIRLNGKFLEVPEGEERDWSSNPDRPYPDGTFFPGGEGEDFGVLVEAEVTIPVGRWQIAFGSDAAGWIHLVDPRIEDPPPPSEDPPPNPVGFHFRVNDNEPLSAAHFGMFDSALWYNSPRPFGWSGVTIDTRNHDQPVTTRLRAFFMETDGPEGLELVIRDTDDGRVGLPQHIGPNNTLLPEEHDWRLLRDGEYDWEVNTVPAPTVGPLSDSDSPLEFPVMNVSGRNLIGPSALKGQLVDDLEDPDDLVLGTPQAISGLVKLRRYFVPDFNEFDSVEDAREFIDLEEPDNEHQEPIAQGFVDKIAWQSGDFYPPVLGFPFVRTDFNNSPNEYGVRIEGELLIPESLASLPANERIIRFKDANDIFAGFVLDLDGDGDIEERDAMDNLLEVVIEDNDPAFALDGFGSPISEALISGSLDTEEDRWRRFEFYMAAESGGDSALLAWDQNVSDDPSVPVPDFPMTEFEPLSPEHVIGPENFRSFVDPILEGELVADLGALANTLIFEVNVEEEKWDTIGIADSLTPDFVIADPDTFERTLEFGDAKIVIDIVEGTPMEGFTIDIVDETVDTIQIQGKDVIEWADEQSDEWQESFLFTYGDLDNWDLSEFLTRGIIRLGNAIVRPDGDYNGNGLVEQADLDLVLGNWGSGFNELPSTWVHQRPTEGFVDQAELDGVLGNWGAQSPASSHAVAVPEPATLLLALLLAPLLAWKAGRSGWLGSTNGSPQRRTLGGSLRCAPRHPRLVAAVVIACSASSMAHAQTGFTGRLLDVSTDVNEHAEALAFLRGIGINSSQVQADVFDLVPFADFGGSLRGDFFADDGDEPLERGLPYPGGTHFPGDDGQDFIVSLEAEVTIPPGTWQIAFGTGDGGAVQIDGVHFTQRYNDVDRIVGTFFDMTHDAVIFDNNRFVNTMGEDRGWTGGTFEVTGSESVTTRLVHTFHQTPHRFENNHLSELIIRDASGGEVTNIGQFDFDPTADNWELLAHSTHDWEVRPTFGPVAGPIDPTEIGPIDHIGGRGLLGSLLRPDTMQEWDVEDLVGRREGMLLVRRYARPTFDEDFTPEDFDTIEEIEDWIQEKDDNGGPEHLGYISQVQWESNGHYPEGLGFDDPFGDADNYVVKITGQLNIPKHDLDAERQKVVSFKDGTADFSGLVVELGALGEHVLIEDTVPTSLDGTDNGGSDVVRALFDFPVIDDEGWVDFTYYVVAGEGDDNALLAWNQNPIVPSAPGFPTTSSAPIRPEHVIRPESFRLTEEIVPDPTAEADLAVFRDEDEDSTRMPMVVFEVDPLTGRSDTLGIEKLNPEDLGLDAEEQTGILDASGVHILLDYITAEPEPGFLVDLLEGSVDEVVGDPVFHFRVPDPASPLNDPAFWSQAWDTSQFTTTGVISFLGLPGGSTTIPEPNTLALVLVAAVLLSARPLVRHVSKSTG